MKKTLFLSLLSLAGLSAFAQTTKTVDLCEKNTDKSYVTYTTSVSVPKGTTYIFRTARYTDFAPTLRGAGTVQLYCGGERTYIGKHGDKSYPDWTALTGLVEIFPYKEVEPNAGFYGAIMNTGGKSYSPEDANPTSKINKILANNRVTLHEGATLATEKSAAGIRIGELNTEPGSRMMGYYKSQSATSTGYYLLGALNTDAVLAGRIASVEKSGKADNKQAVGIIKEGTGTLTLTASDNALTGGLRVNAGTVLVSNDVQEARQKKLTGGTGAAADASLPVAYVFQDGILGGTGNVGGPVDLYGTLAPGAGGQGVLTLANFATSAPCPLTLHPSAVLSFVLTDSLHYNSLDIQGKLVRSNLLQDFTESQAMPQVRVELAPDAVIRVGDAFPLVRASQGREDAGVWSFCISLPTHYSWSVSEKVGDDGNYELSLICTSLTDGEGENPGGEQPGEDGAGEEDPDEEPVPDMGISKSLALRRYLEMASSDKRIGVAVPSTWTYNVPANPNSVVSQNIYSNFNLCVAENEMKIDQVEPNQNAFNFGAADALSQYARNHDMALRGHTLAWHSQVPAWISKDGKSNDKGWTRQQLLSILENHITQCVRHFGANVVEWDVVNETLDDDQSIVRTNPHGYQLRKESVWVKVIGEDFIDSAFVYAHRANPQALLYLNDYGCEFSGNAKTLALFNLAKRLKDSGIPIHGVGLQCHLHADEFDKAKLNSTVRKYAEEGLNCLLTEVDVAIYGQTAKDLKRQAEVYKQLTEVFLQNDNCPHMVIWGINDQYSWISDRHPVLFDGSNVAKPAYRSVREALYNYASRRLWATPITSPLEGREAPREVRRYNLQGMALPAATRGLNLVRMSDGSVRKEVNR